MARYTARKYTHRTKPVNLQPTYLGKLHQARCVYKYRDNNGKIVGYKLQNIATGEEIDVKANNLKSAIKNKMIEVINLSLTSDDRLITTSDKVSEPNGNHLNLFKSAHVIGVAEYMRERALDYELDPDLMYAIGILHDIGYLVDKDKHELYGAGILDKLGVKSEVLLTVAYHGSNIRKLIEEKGAYVVTPMLMLMIEADLSVDALGYRVGLDGRLQDIKARYGDDSPAAINVADNADFIRKYWVEKGIQDQSYMIKENKFKMLESK